MLYYIQEVRERGHKERNIEYSMFENKSAPPETYRPAMSLFTDLMLDHSKSLEALFRTAEKAEKTKEGDTI